jgi:DNA polymerase III gamma/tau subunit
LIADAEGIDAPDQALALVARGARGAYRDAVSTLDQLSSATEGKVTVQAVLQLLGTVEEEALFRLCDLVVDRDTAGALTFVEELSEQGHDLGRLVSDLIEHLRHLMLVQHMHEVPDTLPVTEETRERLRAQANQLGEPTVIRLLDLLAVAVDDMRQGGDPRLPLELALVKVTRPAADLSRETVAFRLEQLEQSAGRVTSEPSSPEPGHVDVMPAQATPRPERPPAPDIELEQLQEAWSRTILPAVEERGGIPTASLLREAHPTVLAGDTLTVEFPPSAQFHRSLAEDPRNVTLLSDALYDVTGRRLSLAFAVGDEDESDAAVATEAEGPAGEDAILELMKETLDAKERGES